MPALPLLGSVALILAASLRAQVPDWWLERGLVSTNAPVATNDFGIANIGQLKHAASAAAAELGARLPGGAGSNILAMVGAWTNGAPGADDFAALNLGQLKATAGPFYDRIVADGGWTNGRPWTETAADDNDFALALVGQLKFAFAFGALTGSETDADGDGMADAWELSAIASADPDDAIAGIADVLPGEDFDGDGIPNLLAYRLSVGLAGRWAFDETFGTVAADSSGNGNGGSVLDGAARTNGIDGGAIAFDGASARVEVPHAPSLGVGASNADFSVALWVNLAGAPTNAAGCLVHKGDTADERTFGIWVPPDGTGPRARVSTTAGPDAGIDGGAALSTGAWTHVVFAKEGPSLRLYLDGSPERSAALPGELVTNAGALRMGDDGASPGARCLMDEVRVYSRALSAEEIAALAARPNALPTNGLVLWLKPGAGVTTNAAGGIAEWADSSGAGNGAAQPQAGLSPLLSTNGAAHPPAEFDGADDFLALGPASGDFAAGFDAFAVVRPTGDGATRPILELGDGPAGDRLAVEHGPSSNAMAYEVAAPGSTGLVAATLPVFPSRLQLLEVEQSPSGAVRLRQSTVAVGQGNIALPAPGAMATNRIGAGTAAGCTNYAGGLTELLVYNRRLGSAERDRVQRYLRDRHSPGDSDWDGVPDSMDASPYTWDGDTNGVPDFQEAGAVALTVYTPLVRGQ